MNLKSNILKIALFATGLSGIVAEYILSTLATYFLGDSVLQWTLIVSVMLFSMGLGSRLSKYFDTGLLIKFIVIEFVLSFMVAYSSLFAYSAAAYTIYTGLIIYLLSIIIGILIGMEIPLVVRLNDEFETLRVNVATVIEKDYYGSLVGGVFFAFVGLPILGLTYTPFVLGTVNYLVALLLLFMLWRQLNKRQTKLMTFGATLLGLFLIAGIIFAKPVILYGEQQKYKDKVIYSEQSRYQKIVITQWKNHYWLYINSNQQLSTLDEIMYHEPLVHPVMQMIKGPADILIMGGGDGCAAREVFKYENVNHVTLVDLDPAMTNLGKNNPVIRKLNRDAFYNPKLKVINIDGYKFMDDTQQYFDAIIIDLPDPHTVELGRLYSREFYEQCKRHLKTNGVLITQAGSPYYSTKAFLCIDKTLQAAGFNTLRIHNQVLTMGEWGWIIGVKNQTSESLKKQLLTLTFDNVKTDWINHEAMSLITSFGKNIYPSLVSADSIEVNSIHNPVLYKYYIRGNWDLY